MSAAIVFAAAPLVATPRLRARLSRVVDPFVVAADGGTATALAFGYTPDVVLGDFDSLSAEVLEGLHSTKVERFPRDKDVTDGQLAIEAALMRTPSAVLLVGFLGGPRLDQALANVLLLTRTEVPMTLVDERNECVLVRPNQPHEWQAEPEEVVSLIPIGGDVQGVRTEGLRWSLQGDTLVFGDTRGVSNEAMRGNVSVAIDGGTLLVTRHFVTV